MTKQPKAARSLLSRYSVTIVMIPAIIGLHVGWSALQKNRSLVSETEEIDLPVVTFYKYCLKKLTADETKATAPKAENS